MPTDHTETWGNKLAELVAQEVVTPPPAENAVNARLTGIDGTGSAALVSKLKKDAEKDVEKYDGFALVFHRDTNYQSFEWLQFITRQLVVNNTAKKGNLITKTNTTSYQLVDSAVEITDFTLATGSKPANWNTCWNVDAGIGKPFFRETYEYAKSEDTKLTAVLDAPSPLTGTAPADNMKEYYQDFPVGLVEMKKLLESHQGISRAYFSDYLVKKDGNNWRIFARFDYNLTWNSVTKDTTKVNSTFTLHSLKATPTTGLLECHKAALLHKTTKEKEPWKPFYDSIVS